MDLLARKKLHPFFNYGAPTRASRNTKAYPGRQAPEAPRISGPRPAFGYATAKKAALDKLLRALCQRVEFFRPVNPKTLDMPTKLEFTGFQNVIYLIGGDFIRS
jgi:hypothetical protein